MLVTTSSKNYDTHTDCVYAYCMYVHTYVHCVCICTVFVYVQYAHECLNYFLGEMSRRHIGIHDVGNVHLDDHGDRVWMPATEYEKLVSSVRPSLHCGKQSPESSSSGSPPYEGMLMHYRHIYLRLCKSIISGLILICLVKPFLPYKLNAIKCLTRDTDAHQTFFGRRS